MEICEENLRYTESSFNENHKIQKNYIYILTIMCGTPKSNVWQVTELVENGHQSKQR